MADQKTSSNGSIDNTDIVEALDKAVDGLIAWIMDWHAPVVTGNRLTELGEQQRSLLHLKSFQAWFKANDDDAVINQPTVRALFALSVAIEEQASALSKSGGHTTDSEYRELLKNVQAFISQARRLERAFAAASSDLDTLTGIQNRLAMRRALERRHDRMERTDARATIALADLDHFKIVNDTYGHHAGDPVLSVAAARMLDGIRSYDQLFRYGGEEFLVLLDDAEPETTRVILERLRMSLEEAPIKLNDGIEITLTASFGAAEINKNETIEKTIERADAALYRAKEAGRNRVILDDEKE